MDEVTQSAPAAAKARPHQATAILSIRGEVLACNSAFRAWCGAKASDPRAIRLTEVFSDEECAKFLDLCGAIKPTLTSAPVVLRPRHHGAEQRTARISQSPKEGEWWLIADPAPTGAGKDEARRYERLTGRASWILEPTTLALSCSPEFLRLLDLDAKEHPDSQAVLALFDPVDRVNLRQALRELIANARPFELICAVTTRYGRRADMELVGRRVDGRSPHIVGTMRDITAERVELQRLYRLETIENAMTNLVVICDVEGRIDWVNPAFERRTCYTLDEIRGRKPGSFLQHKGTDRDAIEKIRDAIHRLRPIRIEISNADKTGKIYWVELEIKPLLDARGRHFGFMAIQTEVTETKGVRAELEAAESAARQASRSLIEAIEALPDGFVLYDEDDRLVLCNTQYRRLYSRSADAIVPGARFEEILRFGLTKGQYPDAEGREEDWLRERLERHRASNSTVEQQIVDGAWLRIIERQTESGGRVGFRVDITAAKEEQRKLREANAALEASIAERDELEQRFLDIAAVSNGWFWEQDAMLRYTFVSDGYFRTTGVDPLSLLGYTRDELAETGLISRKEGDFDALMMASEQRCPFENCVYLVRSATGESRWLRVSGSPLFGPDGSFRGYRGVGSDITELYDALRAAQAASEAKSRFLAKMSHEIRTPLNGMLGMASLLESSLECEDARKMSSVIRHSGESLLTILNDILDLSKIEAGRMVLDPVEFDLESVLAQLVSVHQVTAETKELDFIVRRDFPEDLRLFGDRGRVLQIVHNLLSNAIKFTAEGKIELATTWRPGDGLCLRVVDSGIGIPHARLSDVFDEFNQADNSTTRHYGGTGLGLSITRSLVQLIGGSVTLASELGKGTTVEIRLPLPASTGEKPGEAASEKTHGPIEVDGLRVLVADDNATNRLVLDKFLAKLGVVATIVDGGLAAIDAAHESSFDVLLLDISMPDVDGVETLRAIRAAERSSGAKHVPAVAVTANAMYHQVAELLSEGFNAHLAKPVRLDDLLRTLHRAREFSTVALADIRGIPDLRRQGRVQDL